jgi:(p)ppGpp synthase/HD superfamily hydrolase
MKDLVDICREYACEKHVATNHLYDGKPYGEAHLEPVYNYAVKYSHLLPEELRPFALGLAWTHDIIEDARETYNDVLKICGYEIAEGTFALTNLKGKNRSERAGAEYYAEIRKIKIAIYDKICDRLANVSHSKNTGNSMLKKYSKEFPHFRKELDVVPEFAPMWSELCEILEVEDVTPHDLNSDPIVVD